MRPDRFANPDFNPDRLIGPAAPWNEDPQTVCIFLVTPSHSWSLPFVCPFSHPILLCPCSASLYPLLFNPIGPFTSTRISTHGLATLDRPDNPHTISASPDITARTRIIMLLMHLPQDKTTGPLRHVLVVLNLGL